MSNILTDNEAATVLRDLRAAHQEQLDAMRAFEKRESGADERWRKANERKSTALRKALGEAT